MNKGKRLNSIKTVEDLMGRCVVDDLTGHWVWKGGQSQGQPRAYWIHPVTGLEQSSHGRRAAKVLERGADLPKGQRAYGTCGNPLCVNPEHVAVGTRKQECAFHVKQGTLRNNPRRKAATLISNRAKSKLTMQDVEYIRSSPKLGTDLAKEFGVSTTAISNVRIGRTFRTEAANGFSVFNLSGWRNAA
ncbi:hypothetical protein [Roseateles sp.]|uniref:hypothetical protein n=1 Tax=Roseateles sp. TaxID=1971397 RepID=UPI0031E401FF